MLNILLNVFSYVISLRNNWLERISTPNQIVSELVLIIK